MDCWQRQASCHLIEFIELTTLAAAVKLLGGGEDQSDCGEIPSEIIITELNIAL